MIITFMCIFTLNKSAHVSIKIIEKKQQTRNNYTKQNK